MKELKALMEKAERYIKSAELLVKETDFDSSVSRSYYAMFYAAEAVLLTKDLKFSSHKGVISLFGEHFVKTGIFQPQTGKRLKNAFDRRLIGDYSFTSEVTKDEAKEVLNWAKDFITEIRNYLGREGYIK